MTNMSFTKLFEVHVLHEFYEFDIDYAPDLSFEPSKECHAFLKSQHLHFLSTKNGFKVLCEVKDPSATHKIPVIPISNDSKFTFHIKTVNPYFNIYSGLSHIKESDSLFYFSNKTINPVVGGNTLSKSGDGTVSETDSFKLKPQLFTETLISPTKDPIPIEIAELDTPPFLKKLVVTDKKYGVGHYTFNVRKKKPSVYQWNQNGVIDTFYGSDFCIHNNVFGVIDIVPSHSTGLPFINTSTQIISPKTYSLPFKATMSKWKYSFVLKDNSYLEVSDFIVSKGTDTNLFIGTKIPASSELKHPKIEFESANNYPIKSKPNPPSASLDNNFYLQVDPLSIENKLLPIPSYKNLRYKEVGGSKELFFESLIYL